MKKILISAVLSSSLVGLLIPSLALAAQRNTTPQPRVVFGTICAYTADASATIGQSCGSPSDVTVTLRARTFLRYEGTVSPVPAPVAGDAAAAFVWYRKGHPIAWKLEYSESAFAYQKSLFPGTYVASSGNCVNGTLSTESLGSKSKERTFITDVNTNYQNSGDASTCAAVTAAYTANQPIVVWAFFMTNGNLYAKRINANPWGAHRNPASDQHVVFGILCAYTPAQSAVISQNCGSSSDITVAFDQHTWLVYKGSTSPVPAPAVGDSVAAYLRWRNNFATVGEFAYSEDAFAFARGLFAGTYVTSSGDCTAGGLTIQNRRLVRTTFATDAYTIWEDRGAASTCAAVTGSYVVGEPFIVQASEITDGSWYAVRINAHPFASHRHPGRNLHILFGTICAYTAGQSVTISQNCGSPSDLTVKIGAHAKLVYKGTTTPTPAPVVGDSAAAFLYWHHGPIAYKIQYSEDTFTFAKSRFFGKYVSSDGTCSAGDLTIGIGKTSRQVSFTTDAYTVYLNKNRASTCAAVSGAYASGERLRVDANAQTNDTWYATRIDAHPR